ncbi:MAG: hypothetical protein IJL89_04005, partial [Firmicutes bacterium]|nr:hypothetical protein [Bacillota bacterium]
KNEHKNPLNQTIASMSGNGKYDTLIFIYAPTGGVYFAQICLKGSYLVTYENGEYEVENVKGNTTRKFVSTEKVYATDNPRWGR